MKVRHQEEEKNYEFEQAVEPPTPTSFNASDVKKETSEELEFQETLSNECEPDTVMPDRLDSVDLHRKPFHRRREYSCSFCTKIFLSDSHYYRHLRGVHGVHRGKKLTVNDVTSGPLEEGSAAVEASNKDAIEDATKNKNEAAKVIECEISKMIPSLNRGLQFRTINPMSAAKSKKNQKNAKTCCIFCNKIYSNYYNMIRHVGQHHTKRERNYCPRCSQSFFTIKSLNLHVEKAHPLPEATVSGLKSTFTDVQKSISGEVTSSPSSGPETLNFGDTMPSPCAMAASTSSDTTAQTSQDVTEFSHITAASASLHITGSQDVSASSSLDHTASRNIKAPASGDVTGSTMKISDSEKQQNFGRQQLTKSLRSARSKIVQNEDDNSPEMNCPFCSDTFNCFPSIKDHMNSKHRRESKLECPICIKTFIVKSNVTRHLKLHFPDRRFVCPICLKRFTERGLLDRHFKWHSNKNKEMNCDDSAKREGLQQAGNVKELAVSPTEEPESVPKAKTVLRFPARNLKTKWSLKSHLSSTRKLHQTRSAKVNEDKSENRNVTSEEQKPKERPTANAATKEQLNKLDSSHHSSGNAEQICALGRNIEHEPNTIEKDEAKQEQTPDKTGISLELCKKIKDESFSKKVSLRKHLSNNRATGASHSTKVDPDVTKADNLLTDQKSPTDEIGESKKDQRIAKSVYTQIGAKYYTKNGQFWCNMCSNHYLKKSSMQMHVRRNHSSNASQNASVKSDSSSTEQEKTPNGSKKPGAVISSTQIVVKYYTKDGQFWCNMCSNHYLKRDSLMKHLRMKHSNVKTSTEQEKTAKQLEKPEAVISLTKKPEKQFKANTAKKTSRKKKPKMLKHQEKESQPKQHQEKEKQSAQHQVKQPKPEPHKGEQEKSSNANTSSKPEAVTSTTTKKPELKIATNLAKKIVGDKKLIMDNKSKMLERKLQEKQSKELKQDLCKQQITKRNAHAKGDATISRNAPLVVTKLQNSSLEQIMRANSKKLEGAKPLARKPEEQAEPNSGKNSISAKNLKKEKMAKMHQLEEIEPQPKRVKQEAAVQQQNAESRVRIKCLRCANHFSSMKELLSHMRTIHA